LYATFAAGLCLGQEQPKPESPEQPGAPTPPPAARRSLGEYGPVMEQMTTELKLDASQIADMRRIIEEHQAAARQLQAEMRHSPEAAQRLNEIRERMHQAQQANDEAGVKAATDDMLAIRREQSAKSTPARAKLAQARETLREKVKAVLRDDQKAGFEKIWDEYLGGGSGRRLMRQNPRLLRATVDRLPDLTADQKREIGELFRQYDEATKGQRGPAVETQTQRLHDSVLALLTPQQRERVESRVQSREPRRIRGPGTPEPEQKNPTDPAPPQPEKPGP
jgi:hypothetical protein